MSKVRMLSFEVDIVPLSGRPTTKQVEVPATSTVAEVLKAAGVEDTDKLDILVNGEPAKPDTKVSDGDILRSTERKVRATERVQGS